MTEEKMGIQPKETTAPPAVPPGAPAPVEAVKPGAETPASPAEESKK